MELTVYSKKICFFLNHQKQNLVWSYHRFVGDAALLVKTLLAVLLLGRDIVSDEGVMALL